MALRRRRSRLLSHNVEAIEYRHAEDGLPYRHDFGQGAQAVLLDDGSVQVWNPLETLWEDFNGKPFLVNPPEGVKMATRKRRGAAKRKPPSGFRSWSAWSKAMRSRIGGGRQANPRKRRRRNPSPAARSATSQGGTVAQRKSNPGRKRRRRASSSSAPRRRRRRNPPMLSTRGIVGSITSGLMDAGVGVGAKAAVRIVPAQLGLPQIGPTGLAVQMLTAVVVGFVATKVNRGWGRAALQGALMAPLESVIKKADIPLVAPALGDEGDLLALYPMTAEVSGYPSQFAGYPQRQFQQQ